MPLAIELAASWVHLLSCDEIAGEIQRNLDFLTATMQDMPDRHRSLRAAFDYSWALLTADERRALCGLSIFRGGFTRDAAEHVADAPLPTLAALVSKSLLRRNEAGRYDFHELIRQYAEARLHEDSRAYDSQLDKHMRWFARLLDEHDAPLRSATQKEVIARLRSEMDNIRLAWQCALDHDVQAELRQMMHCWGWFLSLIGHDREGHSIFAQAAEVLGARFASRAPPGAHYTDIPLTYAHALFWQGFYDYIAEQYDLALTHFQECVALARTCDDPRLLADGLRLLAMQHTFPGTKTEKQRLVVESLTICIANKDVWSQARCLNVLGEFDYGDGHYLEARRFFEQALALWRVNGDPNETAVCLCYLGATLAQLGEHDGARVRLEEGLTLSQNLDDHWLSAFALRMLGTAHFKSSDYAEAQRVLAESVRVHDDVRDRWGQALALECLGESLRMSGQHAEARDAYRRSLAIAHRKQWQQNESDLLVCMADLMLTISRSNASHVAPAGSPDPDVGRGSDDPLGAIVQAYDLLLCACQHSTVLPEFVERAQRLRAAAEARLSPEQIASAQSRAQATTVDDVVQALLRTAG